MYEIVSYAVNYEREEHDVPRKNPAHPVKVEVAPDGKHYDHLFKRGPVFTFIYKGKVKSILSSSEWDAPTIAEYKRMERQYVGKDAASVPQGDPFCRQAFAVWIRRENHAASTKRKYAGGRFEETGVLGGNWALYCENIIGGMRVSRVGASHIIQILTLVEERARDRAIAKGQEHTSESVAYSVYCMLSGFFKACTRGAMYYRDDNPVKRVDPISQPEVQPISIEEAVLPRETINALSAAVIETAGRRPREQRLADIVATIVQLSPQIGTRLGETLGLHKSDIDWDAGKNGVLWIRRKLDPSWRAGNPEGWFTRTKGQEGRKGAQTRRVPLSPHARRVLAEYVEVSEREGWIAPAGQDGILFRSPEGEKPMRWDTVRSTLNRANAHLDRKVGFKAHYFRHTFVTMLFNKPGMDIDFVKNMIGQSEKSNTAEKHYAFFLLEKKEEVMDAVGWD